MTFPKSTHPQIEVAVDKHEDEEPSKITATINKMVSLEINWVNWCIFGLESPSKCFDNISNVLLRGWSTETEL